MITAAEARLNVLAQPERLKEITLEHLYRNIKNTSLEGDSSITVYIDATCFYEVEKDLLSKGFVLSSDKVWDLEYTISWD